MEIIVTKEELARGVNTVNKAVPSRTAMSILECVLFVVNESDIQLVANDMELSIETMINGKVKEQGNVAIDAKMLTDLVRKLPDEEVTIKTDDANAHIKCGKLAVDIPCRSGDEFPQIPEVSKGASLAISQFSLKEIIRQTVFSVSDNESNKVMTGELFKVKGNRLEVVALDGHRVAQRKIDLKGEYDDTECIVPAKPLNEIIKIMSGSVSEDVEIYFSENHIVFEFGGTIVTSRLIEGKFFDLTRMLNMEFTTKVTINRKDFLESIDRSTLLSNSIDKKPVKVDIWGDNLKWSIKSPKGSMSEDLSISKDGEDMTIAFNPLLVIDAIKAIDDEEITLHLVNSRTPCQIKDDLDTYMYLILPVSYKE